jgi:hypothetical protein
MPRIDLVVPFIESEAARCAGAHWDAQRKTWFVPEGMDAAAFSRWRRPHINVRSGTYYHIAQTPETCWKCGADIQVFAFILPAGYEVLLDEDCDPDEIEAEDCWQRMDDVCMLSYIEYISPTAQARITALAPNYRRGFSQAVNCWYWMNHCGACGMHQGDHYLFREPQGGFLPTQFGTARDIRLHRIDQPLQASAAYGEAESFAWLWRR